MSVVQPLVVLLPLPTELAELMQKISCVKLPEDISQLTPEAAFIRQMSPRSPQKAEVAYPGRGSTAGILYSAGGEHEGVWVMKSIAHRQPVLLLFNTML
jgi:membrane-associated PAP2 superfamily phosphatase